MSRKWFKINKYISFQNSDLQFWLYKFLQIRLMVTINILTGKMVILINNMLSAGYRAFQNLCTEWIVWTLAGINSSRDLTNTVGLLRDASLPALGVVIGVPVSGLVFCKRKYAKISINSMKNTRLLSVISFAEHLGSLLHLPSLFWRLVLIRLNSWPINEVFGSVINFVVI